MDINAITALITGVGFPIVVCLICFRYIKTMTETHKDEVRQLTEAIQNNTLVMQQLVDKMGGVE